MSARVFGIVKTVDEAQVVVDRLKLAGFVDNAICVLLPGHLADTTRFANQNNGTPGGAMAGASTGGILGGVVGSLAALGVIAIPGLGAFFAIAPIMAIVGAATGATLGGFAGTLAGLGIPESAAQHYEGKVTDGQCLVSVDCEGLDATLKAECVLTEGGAEDLTRTDRMKPSEG